MRLLHRVSSAARSFALHLETEPRPDKEVTRMERQGYQHAMPGLAMAVLAGLAAHRANVNAARALGVPVGVVALLVALALAAAGARAS